jgi:hypothetical protein
MRPEFMRKSFVVVTLQACLTLAVSISAASQTVNLSPTSLSFGNQTVNTTGTAQTVTLTNTGTATLTFTSIIIAGAEHLDFAPVVSNSCGKSLVAGGSCKISVAFSPKAVGARSATIQLTDNASGSPQVVPLSGTGTLPVASWSTTNLSFGSQTIGANSSPQTVTLSNTGTGTLIVSNIVASSSDYSQTNNCNGSVLPNSSCTVTVTFTPSAAWARMGTLVVTGNTVSPPLFLSGMGSSGGSISVSSNMLSFATQISGKSSSSQNVTLTNAGSAPATSQSIYASGDFAQTNTCGLALTTSCTINVTFTPSWSGARTGEVVVNFTDPPMLEVISLSGTGQLPPTTVAISPRQFSLTPTQTEQFQATIGGVSSTSVTWSVDGIAGGNSTVGTISTSGVYAPPGVVGSHTVTATSTANTTKSASVPVFVTNNSGIVTQHNDNGRTGQNLEETVLSPANVNKNQFGKLGSFPVDGFVYAQPLYVEGLNTPSQGIHNTVYVATENDSVYAIDADTEALLWQTSFLNPPNVMPIPSTDLKAGLTGSLIPQIGITGTPVIDSSLSAMFLVAATKEYQSGSGTYQWVQRLHALDIATGAELSNSPVVIQSSVPGSGSGASGGNISFNALLELQRPALLLLDGVVYIGWASQNDESPFHGWVMGYNETTLQQVAVFNTTPNSHDGGVWQSGMGLSADTNGNVYIATGNGAFDGNLGGTDYSDSFLRLNTAGGSLTIADYFSPYNQGIMGLDNLDLGAGGVLLLPAQPGPYPDLLIGGGKTATVYVVDRDNMGGYGPGSDSIVQELENVLSVPLAQEGIRGGPAYFNGQVYFAAVGNVAMAFQLSNGLLSTFPMSESPTKYAYPGATPTISANGSTGGVVWILETDGYANKKPAILHAYDPGNLGDEIYNSKMIPSRDTAGVAVKFTVPTVINGKVFVPTQTELDFYGLLP